MYYKSFIIAFSILILSSFNGFSQNWKKTNEKTISSKEKMQRANVPKVFQLFEVNLANLTTKLTEAPTDISGLNSSVFVEFPDSNGQPSLFEIYNSPMMEPELAAQNPNIHNFTGINKKDPSNVIKISITPAFGMHIMGFDGKGTTYYIDTYTTDFTSYIFYKREDIENSNSNFKCLVENNDSHEHEGGITTFDNQTLSIDGKFRTYRFAMACTVEYAQFHLSTAPSNIPQFTIEQKKDIVLAAMNVTVNRLNAVYERDLSVRLVLVANNKNIIFITSDNFNNENSFILINQGQSVITSIIGNSNYDIGHTVSTGAGGLASPAPCDSSSKAQGVTGSSSPIGDPFDIDYVSHEVGHQFGANHTFNGTTGNCGQGNRYLPAAAEPGSGTTIMGYAGICLSDNVQLHSDPYFHAISIKEITNFLSSMDNNCPTVINSNNARPTITTYGNKTIPHSTPFILSAKGTDANNPNSLTYSWEQSNVSQSSTQPPLGTSTTGPNFRSFNPTTSNSRSFPSTNVVLAGTINPNGIVTATWERIPTVARSMKFTATIRDNNAINGGQTNSADVTITFANAGPFVITYPNNITTTTEPNWTAGDQKTITWNVAGTTGNGINTTLVNILMSEDNGLTYPYTLAQNVPNNGSYPIIVPVTTDTTLPARIKIEAVGNIFYTVSKPFGINVTASNTAFEFDNFKLYPNPTTDITNISFESKTGNNISIEITDLGGRKLNTYSIKNNGSINQEIDLKNYNSGIYLITIKDGVNQTTKKIIKK